MRDVLDGRFSAKAVEHGFLNPCNESPHEIPLSRCDDMRTKNLIENKMKERPCRFRHEQILGQIPGSTPGWTAA